MQAYVTYNDPPSGIYSSQVIDVVKFMQLNGDVTVKLIAFVSVKGYSASRSRIKNELPSAIVVPMFPRIKNWKKNSFMLSLICRYYSIDTVIGRSVLATLLALKLKRKKIIRKVVYDGRGAIAAEWKEYNVVNDVLLSGQIESWEKEAVLDSDYRIAVSRSLVEYWETAYGYRDTRHVIIPCTLNKAFEQAGFDPERIAESRRKLNYGRNDIVFIYSGSLAGWQSFGFSDRFLRQLLSASSFNKLLFLSDKDARIDGLVREYQGQVQNLKVLPAEVPSYLVSGDYGILLRERSVTNKVASPVKFAEYLACGLKVIISEELGDYSGLISTVPGLGYVAGGDMHENTAAAVPYSRKEANRQYALAHFSKASFAAAYRKVCSNL